MWDASQRDRRIPYSSQYLVYQYKHNVIIEQF
jgi:hypothetical protein